jgi:hypothetical protein
MPGYLLTERSNLSPYHPHGIEPLQHEIGVLDLLRDVADEDFPYPQFEGFRVVGLEEVLYAARPEDDALAIEIKRRLQAVASDFQRKMISIQIIFHGTLMHGDTLWVDYRGQRLPIGHIFGSPAPESDAHGNRFYRANFALT